jgi:hypothetical protein
MEDARASRPGDVFVISTLDLLRWIAYILSDGNLLASVGVEEWRRMASGRW